MRSSHNRITGAAIALLALTTFAPKAQAQTYNFNSTDGTEVGWSTSLVGLIPTWGWSVISGSWLVGFNASGIPSRSSLLSPVLASGASGTGTVTLTHQYNFEPNGPTTGCFDGGAAFVSVNGGAFVEMIPTSGNLYHPGLISSSFASPMAGLPAWCGTSPGWSSSTPSYVTSDLVFAAVLGNTYQFAFDGAWDNSVANSSPNWQITQVDISGISGETSVAPEPATVILLGSGLLTLGLVGTVRRLRS